MWRADEGAESFRDLALRHRGRTGLTQPELAVRLGASVRTVQDWEAGAKHPSADRLRALIAALLGAGGLSPGREAEEARALWAAVLRDAPRMRVSLDEVWLADLLAGRAAPRSEPEPDTGARPGVAVLSAGEDDVGERRLDWGDAPDLVGFVGRVHELATLRAWVLQQGCRLVAVLGAGGIGKTTLAAQLAQDLVPSFRRVYWRSLRDAPPSHDWLAGAISFLSDQQAAPPEGEAARLDLLLQLLRERPSLLVLDNLEALLQPGDPEGRYRDGYGGYARLVHAIGAGRHRSCLVLTSREAPPELADLAGGPVRTLELGGLDVAAGQLLLAHKHLSGSTQDWAELIARFDGNGLALKVVGESIREVFGGDLGAFLEEAGAGTGFAGIRRLLAEQLERSSAVEQQVLRVLAVAREPVTLAELLADLGPGVGRGAVLEAVGALRRRSLLERAEAVGRAAFTLQSVVLEYVTDRLVEIVADEIERGQPVVLVEQPIIRAQAKDYVRQTQERLIGAPILARLNAEYAEADTRLAALLDGWRGRRASEQGYGPGNVVNLLRLLRGDLRRTDLSRLALRQVYLQGVDAQDASMVGARLDGAVLDEAFAYPTAIALSADGALLAAGTPTGEMRLWRVADRMPVLLVQGHTGVVRSIAFSDDGRLLGSGGVDGTIKLWEAASAGGLGVGASAEPTSQFEHPPAAPPSEWQLLATLQGHAGAIWGVAISADGRLVASGGEDAVVRLWDAQSGQLVATLKGHTAEIRGVALSGDGRLVVSGGDDRTVRVWEARSGQVLATMQGHPAAVRAVALSRDGRLIASGSVDGTIKLWQASSGQELATPQGQTAAVWALALSGDGRLVASGGDDATVRVWDAASGELLATLQGHTGAVWGVAPSGDGRLVASGGVDGTIRLWDVASGQLQSTMRGHTGAVWGVAVSGDDGRLLATGGVDGTVRLWSAASGQLLVTMRGHTGVVWDLALSGDGRLLVSGGDDETVKLWDTASGQLVTTLKGHIGVVRGVAVSTDGGLVASGGFDAVVRVWEVASGQLVARLQGHIGTVRGVALSIDGRLAASGGTDGTVRLFEVGSGLELASVQAHTGGIRSVALSGDGRLVASGGVDGTITLWETGSDQLVSLQGHVGVVWRVALSRDGRLLASGGDDAMVRLWEARSALPVATLQGHTAVVRGLALSGDGRLVASGSDDRSVRLWETQSGACLRTLQSDHRYQRLDITGLTGVTEAQRAVLLALGAVEQAPESSPAPAMVR